MISTVEGRLRDETDEVDILRSCFPMGSMTGAPKIRTMQRIETLEKRRRGMYSGSVGYISPDRDMDFNVIIRSAICKEGDLFYNTGGAITADSDPGEEWQETIVKAAAILRCLPMQTRQPQAEIK
jgi:para-aminobenzoate synthetase component 1